MTSHLEILALGLLLGIRHAFDADHLIAVTTIVSAYRNPLRAIWVGISWGLGHTTTLLLAGILLLFMKVSLPERVALLFEFLVGVMLIVLGIQVFWRLRRGRVHLHSHSHGDETHLHFHSHKTTADHGHRHPAGLVELVKILTADMIPGEHYGDSSKRALKPFLRLKSYIVGTVHGLAGSAALMLLVLANVRSIWVGVTYILVFGLGTVVSMGLISIFISLPFSISGQVLRLSRVIQSLAGIFSVVFGIVLMYRVGIVGGLLTG